MAETHNDPETGTRLTRTLYRARWEPRRKVTHFIWKMLEPFPEEVVVNLEFGGGARGLLDKRYHLEAGKAGLFKGLEA